MIENQETITFAEFKAWLVGLIRGKNGAMPDLNDWVQIKSMMDKVVPETKIVFQDEPVAGPSRFDPYHPYHPAPGLYPQRYTGDPLPQQPYIGDPIPPLYQPWSANYTVEDLTTYGKKEPAFDHAAAFTNNFGISDEQLKRANSILDIFDPWTEEHGKKESN